MLKEKQVERYGKKVTAIVKSEMLQPQAQLAVDMLMRWGMVAAKENGEDSAGRAKLGLQSPEELVERACTVADLAMKEFKKRKWIFCPSDKVDHV